MNPLGLKIPTWLLPTCDNQYNLLHDQTYTYASNKLIELDLRHKFISLGLGIVYLWRPQLQTPVISSDMIERLRS